MIWLLITVIAFQLLLYGNQIERMKKVILSHEADLEFFSKSAKELLAENKQLKLRIKELEEENK